MMAMPTVQENGSGHLDLTADLRRARPSPFLQRNLLSVVKSHAQSKASLLNPTVTGNVVHSAFETPPKRRKRPFKMKDFGQTVTRQREEEFSFHPKSIRRRTDASISRLANGKEPLSKRLKRNEIQCQCTITIYFTGNMREVQILTRRSAQCSVTAQIDLDDPILDIQIEPFVFKASDLKIRLRGHGAEKVCFSDSYILRTSIFPLDESDLSWPPIPDGRPDSSNISITQFTSKWLLRPGFSTEEILLPINALVKPTNGTAQRPSSQANLGLQVATAWAFPKSALEEYNLSRWKRDIPNISLPTPGPESMSSSKDIGQPVLTYKNTAAAKFIMLDPEPPCGHVKNGQEASLHKSRTPPDLDRSLENGELRSKLSPPHTTMTGLRVVVESGKPKATQLLRRPGAIKQALPLNRTPSLTRHPQLRKHTSNDGTGSSHSVPQPAKSPTHSIPEPLKSPPRSVPQPIKSPSVPQLIKSPSHPVLQPSKSLPPFVPRSVKSPSYPVPQPIKRAPNSVPQPVKRPPYSVPQPVKSKPKRHLVPAAHQTTFFRLRSKRPLKEGDLLDDSDDDFATSWLTQKQSQILDEFTHLSLAERNFMKAYDSYMLSENLGPVCYLPDSILRFIASRKPWLKDPDMSSAFFKLVTKLMVDGATPDDFIKTCREMLYGAEKGKAQDSGQSDDKAEAIVTKKHDDICAKCSLTIATRRHSVICSNKSCQTQVHQKCVGLEQKQPGWTCTDCVPNP